MNYFLEYHHEKERQYVANLNDETRIVFLLKKYI